jgi:hypothetical protein
LPSLHSSSRIQEKSSARKKSRTLHNHDFIYEEENPCLGLIDRVQLSLARAVSMEARNKTDANLNDRSSSKSLGTALKQQVLSLGMEVPMVTQKRIANSIPRVNCNHVHTNSKDHLLLSHVL